MLAQMCDRFSAAAAAILAVVPACESDTPSNGGEPAPMPVPPVCSGCTALPEQRRVDLLFVVDDAPGSAPGQAAVARSAASFADSLEYEGDPLDLRVLITSTTTPHPLCESDQGGAALLRSCREHLGDFADPSVCTDVCTQERLATVATTTDEDDGAEPRPWLEHSRFGNNLGDVPLATAVGCALPLGESGCPFIAPVDAARRAIGRFQDPADPAYGFMRRNALLVIVFVTTRFDCSPGADAEWLVGEDGRPHWPDPSAPAPTPALFWANGVVCEGGPGTYDDCHPAPIEDGRPVVLRPLEELSELLGEIEQDKQTRLPNQEVLLALIGGVPQDSHAPVFWDGSPEQQAEFGIGPGCETAHGAAYPPVRLRALAGHLGGERDLSLGAICDTTHAPVFEDLSGRIEEKIRPACFPRCAADTDPETPGLQPSCGIRRDLPTGDGFSTTVVQPCTQGPDGPVPAAGADVCFVYRTHDNLSPRCAQHGYNLEFQVVRTVPQLPGEALKPSCELSQQQEIDCPALRGAPWPSP